VGDVDIRQHVADLVSRAVRAPGAPIAAGATDEDLAELQSRVPIPLPMPLREWLRVCRGDAIGPGGVFGARPDDPHLDIGHRLAPHPEWLDLGWLPVAGDGNGDDYVLATTGQLTGWVGFVDQADTERIDYVVATDLWRFMRFLLRRDAGQRGWPFDRTLVAGQDPGMDQVPAELRPW
jgi:cell wall assembly regulator SMI1